MNEPIFSHTQSCINHFNMQPSEVKGVWNETTQFYKRYLYAKLDSVFKFTLPKEWAENFFKFWLFEFGSMAVIYTNEFGWIIQPYSVVKLDIYYQPKIIQVNNQLIPEPKVGLIGVNAGIIKCMDDYFGLDDLITRYAQQLAEVDKSISVNLMNSNVSAMFEAETKKQAEEVKEAYGKATTGEPLIVVNKAVMNGKSIETFMPEVGKNYIADKLLSARRMIMNNFLTEIGIRNANYDKKERLISSEVNQNNDETSAVATHMYDNIKACFEEINRITGLELKVELNYNYSNEAELAGLQDKEE